MKKKPNSKKGGDWVFVPYETLTDEQRKGLLEQDMDDCASELAAMGNLCAAGDRFERGCAMVDEFHDYFPGDQEVPKEGAWLLVKKSPPTEFTVPPLSIWFATPWPHQGERRNSHRVKIVTPRGDLGLYPHEYVIVKEPQKYYEFLGNGMEMKFFGNTHGVAADKLFYLRSRGISKMEAVKLLIGSIKAHGVCWIESGADAIAAFVREADMPHPSRLATVEEIAA